MMNKQDLLKVAAAVLQCGISGGYSEAEILAFAKQMAPTKDLDWIAALAKVARSRLDEGQRCGRREPASQGFCIFLLFSMSSGSSWSTFITSLRAPAWACSSSSSFAWIA